MKALLAPVIILAGVLVIQVYLKRPHKSFNYPKVSPDLVHKNNITTLPIFSNHGVEQSPRNFPIPIGGAEILSHYLQQAKRYFGPHTLLLDSGTPFLPPAEKALQFKIRELLPFDAVLFSAQDHLTLQRYPRGKNASIPFVNSNLIDLKNQKAIAQNNLSSLRFINKANINIGVIGIASLTHLSPTQKKKLNGVYFQDPVATYLTLKSRLKNAMLTILLADFSTKCHAPPLSAAKEGLEIPMLKCPPNDPLLLFTKRLPKQGPDIIILSGGGGGSGRIDSILVLNESGWGRSLGRLTLAFNLKEKRVLLEHTQLHPKITTCHAFFASTLDCLSQPPGPKTLVPSTFLGTTVQKDERISKLISLSANK